MRIKKDHKEEIEAWIKKNNEVTKLKSVDTGYRQWVHVPYCSKSKWTLGIQKKPKTQKLTRKKRRELRRKEFNKKKKQSNSYKRKIQQYKIAKLHESLDSEMNRAIENDK